MHFGRVWRGPPKCECAMGFSLIFRDQRFAVFFFLIGLQHCRIYHVCLLTADEYLEAHTSDWWKVNSMVYAENMSREVGDVENPW